MLETKEHQEIPLESERGRSTLTNPSNLQEKSPDHRRRILVAGLATTPILLTLMNRSALAQDINCSALASVILGGSVDNLPPGLTSARALQDLYDAKCKDQGNSGNPTGTTTGNTPS
jgi:hypothetical protein